MTLGKKGKSRKVKIRVIRNEVLERRKSNLDTAFTAATSGCPTVRQQTQASSSLLKILFICFTTEAGEYSPEASMAGQHELPVFAKARQSGKIIVEGAQIYSCLCVYGY